MGPLKCTYLSTLEDIKHELLSALMQLIQPDNVGIGLLKDVLVLIRQICQDLGLDEFDLHWDTTRELSAVLARKIQEDDTDILLGSVHVFSYLADTHKGRQAVIDAGVVPYLTQFLGHNDAWLKSVSLREVRL